MRSVKTTVGIVCAAALCIAACKKSESTPPPKPTEEDAGPSAVVTGKQYFIRNVYPQLSTACGAAGCHKAGSGVATGFIADSAEASYGLLASGIGYIAAPDKSALLNYTHRDKDVGRITPLQRNTLQQWLSFEASERGLAGGIAKPQTLSAAYKAFADCSRYDIWRRAGMERLQYVQTDKEGPCLGCHSSGQGGVYLAASARETFDKSMQFPFIQKFVVGAVDGEGRFDRLVPAARLIEKSNERCPEGSDTCHPTFGMPPEVELAINNFIQATLENMRGGTCDNLSGVIGIDAGTIVLDGGTR